jgi:hypothetical protein
VRPAFTWAGNQYLKANKTSARWASESINILILPGDMPRWRIACSRNSVASFAA